LWGAPFILLLLGGVFLVYQLKKRRRAGCRGRVIETG